LGVPNLGHGQSKIQVPVISRVIKTCILLIVVQQTQGFGAAYLFRGPLPLFVVFVRPTRRHVVNCSSPTRQGSRGADFTSYCLCSPPRLCTVLYVCQDPTIPDLWGVAYICITRCFFSSSHEHCRSRVCKLLFTFQRYGIDLLIG
jgi:hypothetical protein